MNRVRQQRCNQKSQPRSPLASGRFLEVSSGHLLTLLHKVVPRLEALTVLLLRNFVYVTILGKPLVFNDFPHYGNLFFRNPVEHWSGSSGLE